MKTDFDHILKDKINQAEFDLNEAHWQDALQRLDNEGNKKKPIFWWTLATLLLVAVSGSGWYFSTTHNTISANNTATELVKTKFTENNINTNQKTYIQENEAKSSIENVKMALENSSNQIIDNSSQSNNTQFSKPKNQMKENDGIQKNKISQNNFNINSTQSSAKVLDKIATKPLKENRKTSAKNMRNDAIASNMEKNVANSSLASSKTVEPKIEYSVNGNVVNLDPLRIIKSPNELMALNPRYVKGLENYSYTISVKNVDQKVIETAAPEQTTNNDISPVPENNAQRIITPSYFNKSMATAFLMGGATAIKGYRGNNSDKSIYGFSPYFGGGYQLPISNRVNIYFSLFANYLSHINIKEMSTQTTYSFNKQIDSFEVLRKSLLQLQLPVQIGYKLHPRHSVLGGIGFTYGLNTLSDVNSFNGVSKSEWGYTEGLRTFDVNFNFGYEFLIKNNLVFQLLYKEGLLDITGNTYLKNNVEDRNRTISIGVKYNFKK